MKKFIYTSLILGSTLALASCSADEPGMAKNDNTIILTVNLPGQNATRFGDGNQINLLYYSIFSTKADNNGEAIQTGTLEWEDPSAPLQVALDLVPSVEYNVVFFACNSDVTTTLTATNPDLTINDGAYGYNPTTADFKIDYTATIANLNNEAYDAFYAKKKISTNTTETQISLTRPFAQINIGTNDLDKPMVQELGYNNIRTNLIVGKDNLATGMSFLNGTYTEAANGFTKYMGSISNAANLKDGFPIEGYKYLNMMYLLVNPGTATNGQALLDVEFQVLVLNGNEVGSTAVLANSIKEPSLPVRANFQTNIYGALLTKVKDFSVKIQPDFYYAQEDDDFTVPETKETLMSLLNGDDDCKILIPEGTSYDLSSDYTTKKPLLIKKGRTVTIKNNGTLTVEDDTFANQGDLTIDGTGTLNGAIYNLGGNLTIKGGNFVSPWEWGPISAYGENSYSTITVDPFYDDYGSVTITGGTFSNLGTKPIYVSKINSLEIENATITAKTGIAVSTVACKTVSVSNSTLIGQTGGFDGYNWTTTPNISDCTIIVLKSGYCVSTQYNASINVLSGNYYTNGSACVSNKVSVLGGYFNKSVSVPEGYTLQTLSEPQTITWDNNTYSLGYQVVKN